jgi:hypothetical protein
MLNQSFRKLIRAQPQSRSLLIFICSVCLLLGRPESGYSFAIAATGAIDLKGNTIATDSFDSGATNYPGYWTNSIRKAGGDVFTDSTTTNIALGNASIAGHVMTGPGGGVMIQANGSVGDLAWVDSATPGIEPGWVADDMNFFFRDVIIPTDKTWWDAGNGPGEGQAGTVNGVSYAHVFLKANSDGNYYALNDSGDIYVDTNTVIKLKVKSSVGTWAPNRILVAGSGANAGKLAVYVDCANCSLGTTDTTQSKLAENLVYLGTPNCTSLLYKGNGDFIGALYFPQADFQLAGGGSGIIDFISSTVTKTIQMNGHYHFHADEALFRMNFPLLLLSASPPQSRTVVVGQNATFDFAGLGAESFNYQWSFGETVLPDATNSSLSLTNIQLTDAGSYQVTISNGGGSITNTVNLLVYASATPDLQAPALSSGGQFQVTVSGVPGFLYRIYGSTNLTDWDPVSINVSPYTFTDTNTASLPQRYYRAVYFPLP